MYIFKKARFTREYFSKLIFPHKCHELQLHIHDNDSIQLERRRAMHEAMSMHAIFVYSSQSDFEITKITTCVHIVFT